MRPGHGEGSGHCAGWRLADDAVPTVPPVGRQGAVDDSPDPDDWSDEKADQEQAEHAGDQVGDQNKEAAAHRPVDHRPDTRYEQRHDGSERAATWAYLLMPEMPRRPAGRVWHHPTARRAIAGRPLRRWAVTGRSLGRRSGARPALRRRSIAGWSVARRAKNRRLLAWWVLLVGVGHRALRASPSELVTRSLASRFTRAIQSPGVMADDGSTRES